MDRRVGGSEPFTATLRFEHGIVRRWNTELAAERVARQPDIERFDLYGEACNYAPGTSLGTRVVAREADAFMKIEGEVHRFAADPGSRELPMRTRSLYSGKEYSVRLTMEPSSETEAGAAAEADAGVTDYEGGVTLRDRFGRIVYEGVGLAQCKA